MKHYAYIDGEHSPVAQKLTTGQWVMLRDATKHNDPMFSKHGRHEFGPAGFTLRRLQGMGLIDKDGQITAEGRRIQTVEWRDKGPKRTRTWRPSETSKG